MSNTSPDMVEQFAAILDVVLPKGERMSPEDKDFWVEMSHVLVPEQLHQLAKVVAFMRKVEGF